MFLSGTLQGLLTHSAIKQTVPIYIAINEFLPIASLQVQKQNHGAISGFIKQSF